MQVPASDSETGSPVNHDSEAISTGFAEKNHAGGMSGEPQGQEAILG